MGEGLNRSRTFSSHTMTLLLHVQQMFELQSTPEVLAPFKSRGGTTGARFPLNRLDILFSLKYLYEEFIHTQLQISSSAKPSGRSESLKKTP